jgi:hypothetical protein
MQNHRRPPVGNSVAALFVDFRHHRFRPCRESTVGSVEMPTVTTDTSFAASTSPHQRPCHQSRGKYQEFVSDRLDRRTAGRWGVLPPQSGAAGGRLSTNIDRPRKWRRETAFECQLFQADFLRRFAAIRFLSSNNFPRKLTNIPFFVAKFCFAMVGSDPNGHSYARLTSPFWMI